MKIEKILNDLVRKTYLAGMMHGEGLLGSDEHKKIFEENQELGGLAHRKVISMEFLPQVKVSKEDYLALSDLAGDMSIMDYMSKVIHEHVAAEQQRVPGAVYCTGCGDELIPLCPECSGEE